MPNSPIASLTMPSTCMRCRWYDEQSDETDDVHYGDCRRYPPVVVVEQHPDGSDETVPISQFPQIMAVDWCGEFSPR
ncbi:MAG: hypothetical protein AB9M53_00880 [Leptothrix sp. (in: b-proteobacteria)]